MIDNTIIDLLEIVGGMFRELICSPLFLLTLTVGVYFGALILYRRTRWALLNPILIAMIVIMGFLKATDIPYKTYYEANGVINFMLGLSVVALGYLLHENVKYIRSQQWSILFSVFVGSFTGVVSVIVMSRLLGLDQQIIASLQPKSVTTPIALALSINSGGIAALTSVAVIVVGLLGNIVGPSMLSAIGVKSSVARGLALGAGSHAVGTARAMEMGAIEGAIAGASIGLMGVMTAFAIPIVEKIMLLL